MDGLIRQLQERGRDLDPEEMADALWLAMQMGQVAPVPFVAPEPGASEVAEMPSPVGPQDLPRGALEAEPTQQQPLSRPALNRENSTGLYRPSTSGFLGAGLSAVGYRVPGVVALPRSREVAMALRPLLRRVPRSGRWHLDEEETVRRVVEERIWYPALSQDRSRWAELALVVDGNDTMRVWCATVAELRRLLERHGAFRDVRTWGLDTTSMPRLRTREIPGRRPTDRDVKELLDPTGRRLIIVLTDCMAPAWADGSLAEVMDLWGQSCPVAILQVLPPRMWPRTPLGLPPLRLSATEADLPNSRLKVTRTVLRKGALPIPVMSLEAPSILRWAQVLGGQGRAWVQGVSTDRFRPVPVSFSITMNWGGEETEEADQAVAPPTARERLTLFGRTASAPARALTSRLAGLPVSLPVVRLVHQLFLGQNAQHAHIAELFLSDLLIRITPETVACDPEDVEYEFYEGVRDLLLEGRTGDEIVEVTDRVVEALSSFVGNAAGSVTSFRAALADPVGTGTLMLPPGSRRFAQVTADALRRYGGIYAKLAQSLDDSPECAEGVTVRQRGKALEGHTAPIRHIAWSSNGNLLASPAMDRTVRIWSMDGTQVRMLQAENAGSSMVAWSPQNLYLACDNEDYISIWDAKDWKVTQHLSAQDGLFSNIAWSPDGHYLAGATDSGVRLWDMRLGVWRVLDDGNPVAQVAWSPTATKLAIAPGSGMPLRVWDPDRSDLIFTSPEPGEEFWSVAWQPDGKYLFVGSNLGRILLWSRSALEAMPATSVSVGASTVFHEHNDLISSMTFSADGRMMASKSNDGTVRLWQSDPWRVIAILPEAPAEDGTAGGIAFHPHLPILATLCAGGKSIRLWDIEIASKEPPYRRRYNPVDGAEMVWIPEGSFLMGGTRYSSEQPVHSVMVSGFWMYKTPVTVAQFRKYDEKTEKKYDWKKNEPSWGWQDDHPMVNVSWTEASAYAQWAGVQLPTEAEWEKAARGGLEGKKYPWGDEWDGSKCANSVGSRLKGTMPVGSYDPNGYALYDMAGNVWEWCADWHDSDYYKQDSANSPDPTGPSKGSARVLRGGSWLSYIEDYFRCAYRYYYFSPDLRGSGRGFRCAVPADSY